MAYTEKQWKADVEVAKGSSERNLCEQHRLRSRTC